MDGRVKSLDGNRYGQVFSNDTFFAEGYPISRFFQEQQHMHLSSEEAWNGFDFDFSMTTVATSTILALKKMDDVETKNSVVFCEKSGEKKNPPENSDLTQIY